MKKLLLSIFGLMLAFTGIQAQEVVLDFTDNTVWQFPTSKTVEAGEFTNNGYTVTVSGSDDGGYYFYSRSNSQYCLYFGKTNAALTLPAFDFAVSKIEVLGEPNGAAAVKENIFVGDVAVSTACTSAKIDHTFEIDPAYQAAGNIYTLKVTNSNSTRVTGIKVYKLDETATEKPEITTPDNATKFDESLEITITAAEGAKIYYTLDGTEPTTASTEYAGPFTISATATVNAIAVANDKASDVVTAKYFKILKATVTEALAAYDESKEIPASITGYIVGYVDTSNSQYDLTEENGKFGADGAVASNILIADDANETDYTKCIPVQLPSSLSVVREALNLQNNPDKLLYQVVISGDLTKYCGVAGLKNPSAYEFTGVVGESNGDNGEGEGEGEEDKNTIELSASLFPAVSGDITKISAIRVESNSQALADLPTEWTLTDQNNNKYPLSFEWLSDFQIVLVNVIPAIEAAGTYTLTIPAGSLKDDYDNNCKEYTFTWTINGDNGEGEGEEDNELKVTDIENIISAGPGEAKAEGVVYATYTKGFLLNDGTASILVYLDAEHEYTAGDYLTVTGTTSTYGGLLQFGKEAIIEKASDTKEEVEHEAITVMDAAAMEAYLTAPAVKYVEYTGVLTISGTYYNIAIEGTTKAVGSISNPAATLLPEGAVSGATIKVTGYLIGVSSSKFVNTMATAVEVVEEAEPQEPIVYKEYTVAEALAAYDASKELPAIITGYIVGAIDSNDNYRVDIGTTTVVSNIIIAADPNETERENCIPVQLPSGSDVRSALNLNDNTENYKKEVKITGTLMKYFSQAGLKNPTAYEFTGKTAIESVDTEAEDAVIYDLAGRRIEKITTAGIYIVNGRKVLVK